MFDEKDVRFDAHRYGDSNTRVVATHIPSGLSVEAFGGHSEEENKEIAFRKLRETHRTLSLPIGIEVSSLEATDAASEAVRTGFRITLDYLKSRVDYVEYITRAHLTIAVIKMDNGYYLVGKSASVDPTNFNAELGCSLAYDDGLRQAWPLFAFAHLEKDGPVAP